MPIVSPVAVNLKDPVEWQLLYPTVHASTKYQYHYHANKKEAKLRQ